MELGGEAVYARAQYAGDMIQGMVCGWQSQAQIRISVLALRRYLLRGKYAGWLWYLRRDGEESVGAQQYM